VALLGWLIEYLLVGQYFISTDDAYVAADTSMIAAKVSGYVTAVPVKENQIVRAGDVLAVIDPRDYQTALAAAWADVLAARAAIASDVAQLSLQQAKIQAAQAAVTGDEARVDFAAHNQRRYARLSTTGASPVQTADQATTDLATARAQLAADQAALLGAQRNVGVLNAALAQATASLAQAQAHADQAALDLSHTAIRAPFDGQIGNKTVAVGDYLQAGTMIMAIVPITQVFVTANYKETQITRMAPGQKVRVDVDGYPNLKVTGVVDSISPASGQEFALLPPDNATGNFTKIVQRVPVKILLNLTPDLVGKLRPGMSVEPDIDTRRAR
jgi:membrane fusion protein (multidrug efflux system)